MLDRPNVENVRPTSRVGGRVESPETIFRKRLPSVFSAFYVHRWDWTQVASMLLRARPTLVRLSFFYSRCYFTEVYKRVAQNERVNIRSKGGVNRVEIVLPLKFYPCSFPGQSSGSGKTPLLSFLGLRLRSSILTRANGTTNASFDAKLPLSTATASSPEGLSSQPDARSAMERRWRELIRILAIKKGGGGGKSTRSLSKRGFVAWAMTKWVSNSIDRRLEGRLKNRSRLNEETFASFFINIPSRWAFLYENKLHPRNSLSSFLSPNKSTFQVVIPPFFKSHSFYA